MANRKLSDPSFRQIVYEKCDGRCGYCGDFLIDGKFQIDHIEPKRRYKHNYGEIIIRGGDSIDNLMPCCISCNSCKSDLSVESFRERVLDRINRLHGISEYNIALRFGLVEEKPIDEIVFYFETLSNG